MAASASHSQHVHALSNAWQAQALLWGVWLWSSILKDAAALNGPFHLQPVPTTTRRMLDARVLCRCRNDVFHLDLHKDLMKGFCDDGGGIGCFNVRRLSWRLLDDTPANSGFDLYDDIRFHWFCGSTFPWCDTLFTITRTRPVSPLAAFKLYRPPPSCKHPCPLQRAVQPAPACKDDPSTICGLPEVLSWQHT